MELAWLFGGHPLDALTGTAERRIIMNERYLFRDNPELLEVEK